MIIINFLRAFRLRCLLAFRLMRYSLMQTSRLFFFRKCKVVIRVSTIASMRFTFFLVFHVLLATHIVSFIATIL